MIIEVNYLSTISHEPRLDVPPEAFDIQVLAGPTLPNLELGLKDLTLKDSQTPSPLESTACGSTDTEPSSSPKDCWMKHQMVFNGFISVHYHTLPMNFPPTIFADWFVLLQGSKWVSI